jgi:hypothetical protein
MPPAPIVDILCKLELRYCRNESRIKVECGNLNRGLPLCCYRRRIVLSGDETVIDDSPGQFLSRFLRKGSEEVCNCCLF